MLVINNWRWTLNIKYWSRLGAGWRWRREKRGGSGRRLGNVQLQGIAGHEPVIVIVLFKGHVRVLLTIRGLCSCLSPQNNVLLYACVNLSHLQNHVLIFVYDFLKTTTVFERLNCTLVKSLFVWFCNLAWGFWRQCKKYLFEYGKPLFKKRSAEMAIAQIAFNLPPP